MSKFGLSLSLSLSLSLILLLCFASTSFAADWLCQDANGKFDVALSLDNRDRGEVVVSKEGKELLVLNGRFIKSVNDFSSDRMPRITTWSFSLKNTRDEMCFLQRLFTRTHPDNYSRDTLYDSLLMRGLLLESRCPGSRVVVQTQLRCTLN